MALNLFIGAFGAIQTTLLNKSLDFRKQCVITIASVVVSGIIAVILAWKSYGVWSLAVSSLASIFVSTLLLWLLNPWRPTLVFSLASIRSLFKFGGFLLISGLLDTLYTRLNTLVIGKFYSPRDLGFYSRADGTQQLPANLLTGIISRVAFPIFSAAQQDKNHLRAGLRKAIALVMMINIPVMLGMFVTSRLLIQVLFGNQWLPSVPYLQILCLGGILWPLHVLNLNTLLAQGHSKLFFRLEVIKKIIGVAILGTACFFGITAIAWSIVATSLISFAINAHYSGRFLNYGIMKQGLDLVPYTLAGLGMALFVWGIGFFTINSPLFLLLAQVLTGMMIYAFICGVFRLPAFTEAIQLLGPRLAAKIPFKIG